MTASSNRREIGRGQATLTLPWTQNGSNPVGCKSMMSICRNHIVRDREAHGTETVPWLPAEVSPAGRQRKPLRRGPRLGADAPRSSAAVPHYLIGEFNGDRTVADSGRE